MSATEDNGRDALAASLFGDASDDDELVAQQFGDESARAERDQQARAVWFGDGDDESPSNSDVVAPQEFGGKPTAEREARDREARAVWGFGDGGDS